jgi:hypothetical protein
LTLSQQPTTAELGGRLRIALELSDLGALEELLDPDVHWGSPDVPLAQCTNRDQVLAWWKRAHDEGTSARVTEMTAGKHTLLVGLRVRRRDAPGDEVERWQLLTVADGRVVEILGFEERAPALARAALSR